IKILREHVNRKRFQSRQDFGAFFNIPCYWAVTIDYILTTFINFLTKIIIFLTKILVKKKKKCYNDIKIKDENEFIRKKVGNDYEKAK
ncbi:TPA: hypothetical protein ACGO35_001953, partial [Streptococcus suis]